MKTKFQFTRKNLLRLIINELVFLLIPIPIIIYVFSDFYFTGLIIFYGVFSFIILPPFILFTEYYLKNRNMYFEFSNDEFSVYKKGKENKTIPFSQIKKVISVDSVHYEKKGWRMTPSTDYHYIIFELESGGKIIMTSLLYRNAKDVLKYFSDKIVYYRHPAMYSWINDKYNIYI